MLKLDYSIKSPEERKNLVEKILEENPEYNLNTLADYLILCMEKQEKKEKKILTENRMVTVNKRELSFEGLVGKMEKNEDGIYQLIKNDKNIIFKPKISITKKDKENSPELRQTIDAIQILKKKALTAKGKDRYVIHKAIIDLQKDQYIIKQSANPAIIPANLTRSFNFLSLVGEEWITDVFEVENDKEVLIDEKVEHSELSLLNWKLVSAILCNYSKLKQSCAEDFKGDLWFLLKDFDDIAEKAFKNYPILEMITTLKIDGVKNKEIQEALQLNFGFCYSKEYLSCLWRQKIPRLIASQAEHDFLIWYFSFVEKGKWKKCSRCGEYKLLNRAFFTMNRSSKTGFYSICKECRNRKVIKHVG